MKLYKSIVHAKWGEYVARVVDLSPRTISELDHEMVCINHSMVKRFNIKTRGLGGDTRHQVLLFEIADEYYVLAETHRSSIYGLTHLYYICDTIDGVKQYLHDRRDII